MRADITLGEVKAHCAEMDKEYGHECCDHCKYRSFECCDVPMSWVLDEDTPTSTDYRVPWEDAERRAYAAPVSSSFDGLN